MRRSLYSGFGTLILAALLSACSSAPPYGRADVSSKEASRTSSQTASPAQYEQWRQLYRGLLGTPYRYGGDTKKGFDCSGLVGYLYRQYYGRRLPRKVTDLYRKGKEVGRGALRAGDLVFFNTTGRGASHVGIYLGNRRFLHASTSRGVVITHLDEGYYARRYLGARRI